ncbi:putative nuclease HARBI1 [Dreissena polymorpha]|uniref:putative nuclease HARBI1 n=1 Tax=Dreissena polymorpha TaxID=45954 RepID=UPI002264BF20|nr:putative nuclease HARBI1 [Dreissena polymorpha]
MGVHRIKFPRLLGDTKAKFYSIAGFPNVIGVIDCTHVKVLAPREYEADYVNRKGYHSLDVQMVCDSGYRFLNVVAKWPGSVHDARIFRNSLLCQHLENGTLDGCILGDSGYPSRRYLMTPYLQTRNRAQERYNRSLLRTRVIVEQAFGVLKRRFACLAYGLRCHPGRCCSIIIATVFLHNYGLDCGDILEPNQDMDVNQPPNIVHQENNNGI